MIEGEWIAVAAAALSLAWMGTTFLKGAAGWYDPRHHRHHRPLIQWTDEQDKR